MAYARSVPQLGEDLQTIRPTMLISVPRIYERVWDGDQRQARRRTALRKKLFQLAVDVGWARFEHAQGRAPWTPGLLLWPVLKALVASKILARLGGRLRAAFAGGAALSPEISRVFIGLGLPVMQGYGLTETSPVACANRPDDNLPASVGKPIPGVEVRIGDKDALLIKGPNVMLGYWNNPEATQAMIQARRLAQLRRHRAHRRARPRLHHRPPEGNHRDVERREDSRRSIWRRRLCAMRCSSR